MDNQFQPKQPSRTFSSKKAKPFFAVLLVLFAGCAIFFQFFISAPSVYPTGTIITIQPGSSLGKVTFDFRNAGVIRSSSVFQTFAIVFGAERKAIAGDYLFSKPENAIRLAWRVARGNFDTSEIKVTIPEGFTVADIGELLSAKLSEPSGQTFSANDFIRMARGDEGYLFPDTYFLPPSATTSQIIDRMKNNFSAQIGSLRNSIAQSGYPEKEIVIMASILEGEATSTHDRQLVAGILLKRLNGGLLLQMDSTLKYVTGKGSGQLTMKDLQINSPYNTYRFKGLPPGPINNPGLDALTAAVRPIASDYLYFLTGKDGGMHYAKTYAEHKANIEKYL